MEEACCNSNLKISGKGKFLLYYFFQRKKLRFYYFCCTFEITKSSLQCDIVYIYHKFLRELISSLFIFIIVAGIIEVEFFYD